MNAAGAVCSRNDRVPALGSSDRNYWGRFNVDPSHTDTSLWLVFPANTADPPYNPAAAISDNRKFSVVAYNDDEWPVSTPGGDGPEFIVAPFDSTSNPALPGMPVIAHSTYVHGEALLTTAGAVPMFGFVSTTVSGGVGAGSDIYPLINGQIGIMINNEAIPPADLITALDIIFLP
jgi:hypothetical protein